MLLVFPPQAPAFSPHLALPQLAGYLKANGYTADIVDLNVLFYDYLLQEFVNEYSDKSVASAIATLRNRKKFYSISEYELACKYVLWALDIQKKKCGFKNRLLSAEYNFSEYSSKEIMQNIEEYDALLFPIFEMFLNEKLLENKLVGISVSYASQLVPAISLCRYIRKKYPDCMLVLGGSHITSIYFELKKSCLNTYFDHLISGPGEKELLRLAQEFESPFENCSIECEKGPNQNTKKLYAAWGDMKDYHYLSPELVIPLCVSEGCYWGKCNFCNHESLHGNRYRIATVETAVEYINMVREQTGANHFTFVDSVLPIAWLESFAEYLCNSDIVWEACVRFDKGDYDFEKLYRGGCRLLRFGLESGSQHMLDAMNKGIRLETAENILKECFHAGIGTFVFFFTGFPGETQVNAYETIDFLKNNGKHINFANGGGIFYLGKNSPIYNTPSSFMVDILLDEQHDISLNVPYISHVGMSEEKIYEMASIQRSVVHNLSKAPHGIISQIYDIHDFLYVVYYGAKGLKDGLYGGLL